MGVLFSRAIKKLGNYNVENRAHKVISREKPVAAPKYAATVKEMEKIVQDFPEVLEEQQKKHPQLLANLKDVFVVSHDPEIVAKASNPSEDERPLPLDRKIVDDYEYGFKEPSVVPRGRYTLRQALTFITDYQVKPQEWTVSAIASEYKLDEKLTESILKRFRVFTIHMPDEKTLGKYVLVEAGREDKKSVGKIESGEDKEEKK